MLLRVARMIAVFAGLASLAACSVFGGQAAPEPDYRVVLRQDPYELRDYGQLVVVKTPMRGGSNAAFGRLFNYISGENQGARKIEMTAPVLNADAVGGTEIAMTAPVLQSGEGNREMVFVLTDGFTPDTAPVPSDPLVSLSTLPPRRVAAVRYSGFMDSGAQDAEQGLREWMKEQDLTAQGPAEVAGYNPPWTLPFFRRNEVLIPVDAKK